MDYAGEQSATPHWTDPDTLIIGAGASGAAVAWRLAEAGLRVVCLEQGDWVDPRSMAGNSADWELRRLTDFHPDPNVRRLPADYPVNDSASAYTPLMFNAVGGSTIHWSAHCPRFHPSDFRVRSLDGVADDWPLTYDEPLPVVQRSLGLSGEPPQPRGHRLAPFDPAPLHLQRQRAPFWRKTEPAGG